MRLRTLVFIGCLALVACASKPPKPAPMTPTQIVVSADVNPDSSGRASPIVVRLFQLRNDGEFATADFFPLYDKEKEVLGASLISREEYVLVPGEKRAFNLAINPDARFIGVIAAYRDIRSARWRALTQPPQKKLKDLIGKHGVTVSVDKDAVTLAVKD
ncbi:MAG TPA: type VI secretion system lipoprotein TssJ [Steroidobacteraceae bacterium]|nr:type VI secretion system lipoprotein TssJ [Steroidobacteraceae bacterium]